MCRGWEFPPAAGFTLEIKKQVVLFIMLVLVSFTEVRRDELGEKDIHPLNTRFKYKWNQAVKSYKILKTLL